MEPTQEQANEERIDETVGNEIVGNERPVDPDFDASRIAQMLHNAGANILLNDLDASLCNEAVAKVGERCKLIKFGCFF